METIEEQTGLSCWKLVIVKEDKDRVKVAIQGVRGGEKAWVRIPLKDLEGAVLRLKTEVTQ